MDTERLNLVAESLAVALQRKLARRIKRLSRYGDKPCERADVNNAPTLPCSHGGQHSVRHPHDSEEIGLEDRPRFVDVGLFGEAQVRDASVVHQYVDSPLRIEDRPHAYLH